MTRRLEDVVELLRRSGAGALPVCQIRAELRRREPQALATTAMLRALAERSNGRLLLLEAHLDTPPSRQDRHSRILVAWMVLMSPDDEPDQSRLASQLWRSLAALASAIDPVSRGDICRWVLQARQAHAALRRTLPAARRRGAHERKRRP